MRCSKIAIHLKLNENFGCKFQDVVPKPRFITPQMIRVDFVN